jgi:hypothetical protein
MSRNFAAVLRQGRTWVIHPNVAHIAELSRYEFPPIDPDTTSDITSETYRNHMEVHCGAYDAHGGGSGDLTANKAHLLFNSLIQARMPVSSSYDTVMIGIRQRAQEITRIAVFEEREARMRELYPQFNHFWTASNDGGGPLKKWIEVSTMHRNSPTGMWLIGMTPVADGEMTAFDAYLDNIMMVADTTFSFVSAHRQFALGTLAMVDAGRRSKNTDGLRTTVQFEGPPGQGKSRLLARLKKLLPDGTYFASTFDSDKAKLSMGDWRAGVEFHDDVSPDTVGCPRTMPGQQPSVWERMQTRRAKDANQNRASGFAVQYAKSAATSNEITSRTATIADGVRSTIEAKAIQYMTIFRNINADRWDMDSALYTRAIHIAMYIGNSQGVGQTSNNPALDAWQLDRAKLMFSKIMALSVEANCQMDCGLLPEIDDTIAAGILSALARNMHDQGYADRDAELPRKREQLTVIACAAVLVQAIFTVFGDLGINAPDYAEKFDHHHLQLLKPYLYTTRGITMYCAEIPNIFVDDETVYVARALIKRGMRYQAQQKSQNQNAADPMGKRPGVLIESDNSEPAPAAASASASVRAKQQAEIDRNLAKMGIPFGGGGGGGGKAVVDSKTAAASKASAVAAAAAVADAAKAVAEAVTSRVDGDYFILQNYFKDLPSKRNGAQPGDHWYVERLVGDLDKEDAIECRLPRPAIINALTDLTGAMRSADGKTFYPLRFEWANMIMHKAYMTEIATDAVYCTLQRMYATCDPTVFRRYPASRDQDGNEVFRRAATGIVGGGATGGVSYERYMEAKAHYQRGGGQASGAASSPSSSQQQKDEIADLLEAAEYADSPSTVLLPASSLSAEIKNPAYREDTEIEDMYNMGFIDAEMVMDSAPSEKIIDTRRMTDHSVAVKLAAGCVSSPDKLPLYHSIPANNRRLVKAHHSFQVARRNFARELHLAYTGNVSPFDQFAKSFMNVVSTLTERCTAYRTYYALNGAVHTAWVMEVLSTHGCRPQHHRPGGQFTIPFHELATAIAAHVQCYVNFVDHVRVLKEGAPLTIDALTQVEGARLTHEAVFGRICSYWADYKPGETVDTVYRGRWSEREFIHPNIYYKGYRDAARDDYDLASGKRAKSRAAAAAAAAKPPVRPLQQPPPSRRALSGVKRVLDSAASAAAAASIDLKHGSGDTGSGGSGDDDDNTAMPTMRIMKSAAASSPMALQPPTPPSLPPPPPPPPPSRPSVRPAAAAAAAAAADMADDSNLTELFQELMRHDSKSNEATAATVPPPAPEEKKKAEPVPSSSQPAAAAAAAAAPAAPAQRPPGSIWDNFKPVGSKRKSAEATDTASKQPTDASNASPAAADGAADGKDDDEEEDDDDEDGEYRGHVQRQHKRKRIGSKYIDDHADASATGANPNDDEEGKDLAHDGVDLEKYDEDGIDEATGYATIAGDQDEPEDVDPATQNLKLHALVRDADIKAEEDDIAEQQAQLAEFLKRQGVKDPSQVFKPPAAAAAAAAAAGADDEDDDIDDLTPPPPPARRISRGLRRLADDDDDPIDEKES